MKKETYEAMKKILFRISVIVSFVCVILAYAGGYLQSKKDLTIRDPKKFDAMMDAVHAGDHLKTIAAWVAIAAAACWAAFGIAWLIGIKKKDFPPA